SPQIHVRGSAKCVPSARGRSEEHTSELQSLTNLVCRLLLEKKNRRLTHSGSGPSGCPRRSRAPAPRPAGLGSGRDGLTPHRVWRAGARPPLDRFFFLMIGRPPRSTLFPSTTLFR